MSARPPSNEGGALRTSISSVPPLSSATFLPFAFPQVPSRRSPRRFPFRASALAPCALLVLLFAGCATKSATDKPYSTHGWEDHRLANSPAPYQRLLVEIDSVAGCEPTPAELAALRAFLATHIDKPAGIELRVDPPIPRAEAAGRSVEALTLAHLSGPTDDHTAFIYILFFRSSRLGLFPRPKNPSFTNYPFPSAIYIDRASPRFKLIYPAALQETFLLHEAGHALGLARNPEHSARGHCIREGCLMRETVAFNVRRFYTFRPSIENTTLCTDCRADLARFRTTEPSATERHWRGYHRRDGTGYTVLTLPRFFYVHFGAFADLDPDHLAGKRRDSLAAQLSGDTQTDLHTSSFSPADHTATFAHFWREQTTDDLHSFVEPLLVRFLDLAEERLTADPAEARAILSDDLLPLLVDLPSHLPRFDALRAKLPPP